MNIQKFANGLFELEVKTGKNEIRRITQTESVDEKHFTNIIA
ncbi:hypothetical protein [Melissococcus plutonius]